MFGPRAYFFFLRRRPLLGFSSSLGSSLASSLGFSSASFASSAAFAPSAAARPFLSCERSFSFAFSRPAFSLRSPRPFARSFSSLAFFLASASFCF